jgi:hypothetical protein
LWWRRNKRAAVCSLICGGATAVNSLLTNYPGGIFRVISYKNHGRIDAGIAGLTAAMPNFMSLKKKPESRFFSVLAMSETAIVGLTDFLYYQQGPARRRLRD